MPIEHFGLGVPDVDAAKAYYDEFMPLLGYMPYLRIIGPRAGYPTSC